MRENPKGHLSRAILEKVTFSPTAEPDEHGNIINVYDSPQDYEAELNKREKLMQERFNLMWQEKENEIKRKAELSEIEALKEELKQEKQEITSGFAKLTMFADYFLQNSNIMNGFNQVKAQPQGAMNGQQQDLNIDQAIDVVLACFGEQNFIEFAKKVAADPEGWKKKIQMFSQL